MQTSEIIQTVEDLCEKFETETITEVANAATELFSYPVQGAVEMPFLGDFPYDIDREKMEKFLARAVPAVANDIKSKSAA